MIFSYNEAYRTNDDSYPNVHEMMVEAEPYKTLYVRTYIV